MKQIHYLILTALVLLGLSACHDDLAVRPGGELPEGKVRIELAHSSAPLVQSRADASPQDAIGSVAVFVFNDQGEKRDNFVLSSSENIRYIDVYFAPGDASVYVVANHPTPETLLTKVKTLDDLKKQALTIDAPDGACPGKYIMEGHATVTDVQASKKIQLNRLAAHLEFNITVNTSLVEKPGDSAGTGNNGKPGVEVPSLGGDGGSFELSAMYLCQVPRGTYLLERNADEALLTNQGDWVFNEDPEKMNGNYFSEPVRLDVKGENGTYSASFNLFENRRGAVEENPKMWPEIIELQSHPLYPTFRKLYKRTRAMDYPDYVGQIAIKDNDKKDIPNDELRKDSRVQAGQFYNATYLRIDGVYNRPNSMGGRDSYETSYYVYLGHDADRDFNIRRNHLYNHNITIRSLDNYDHRVTESLLDGLFVQAPDAAEPLDAHCNVVKVLIYAPEAWTVSVENPDETPWLEVSTSAAYKPRLLGMTPTGEEAAFSLFGEMGVHYFYIHTDEYIPDIESPEQNDIEKTRTGSIVCRCAGIEQRIPIVQQPAQLVNIDLGYDPHTMQKVYYQAFIENKQEQKYMPWGFIHKWCWTLDDLIAAGTWDGLSNTRQLYEVGVYGDYNEILNNKLDPLYPDGLPYDHAIGYIISKNRDRNGNGKIDYNEITWYWPAIKEMQKIVEAYRQDQVELQTPMGVYHVSTPSSSDRDGITPGFSYTVTLPEGKRKVEQRDRHYNVIACRRKDAWKGPDGGTGSGDVTTDPNWGEGDEVIIPRTK